MKTKKTNRTIISAGHICLDITPVFPQGRTFNDLSSILIPGKLINMDGVDIHTGGSVANTGLALKKLGCSVTLLGKVGDDQFGNIVKNIVASYGASGLLTDKGSTTSYSVVLAPPGTDRIFLHNPGANDTFCLDDIPDEALSDAAMFHFGYPTLMKKMYENGGTMLASMFERIKEKGIATSLDLAAIDPDSPPGRANWEDILGKTLPYVDFFAPSFEELCFMLNRDLYDELSGAAKDIPSIIDMKEHVMPLARRSLEMGCKVVLIKCGTAGMYYLTSDRGGISQIGSRLDIDIEKWAGKSGIQPCFKVEHVLSATGAGDTSIATFLACVLEGMDPAECVRLATLQGACCVTAYDALSGLKTIEELLCL